MNKNKSIIFPLLSILLIFSCDTTNTNNYKAPQTTPQTTPPLRLISSSADDGFDDGQMMPAPFGYIKTETASTRSFPKLKWENVPAKTQSLLLVLHDESVPDWPHGIWVIDPAISEIPRANGNNDPNGMGGVHATIKNGSTILGVQNYYAPSPPPLTGAHTYVFKLYATSLSTNDLKTAADAFVTDYDGSNWLQDIESNAAIQSVILGTSQLTGKYENAPLHLTSSSADDGFDDGQMIPAPFGYIKTDPDSTRSFPKLKWENVPAETESLLLVLHDESVPTWPHGIWVIDPAISEIPRANGNNDPKDMGGVHATIKNGSTILGVQNYYAPSPPAFSGVHTYVFKLYATSLSTNDLKTAADAFVRDYDGSNRLQAIESNAAIQPVILGTSQLTGKYENEPLRLTSSSADDGFDDGEMIPAPFGYTQLNTASTRSFPKLKWENVPAETQSLLLVLQDESDPDHPHGIWVIDPSISEIPRADGNNDRMGMGGVHATIKNGSTILGVENYYAPSPLALTGVHTYVFKLYATSLSTNDLKNAADAFVTDYDGSNRLQDIESNAAIQPVILETSQLTGKYEGDGTITN